MVLTRALPYRRTSIQAMALCASALWNFLPHFLVAEDQLIPLVRGCARSGWVRCLGGYDAVGSPDQGAGKKPASRSLFISYRSPAESEESDMHRNPPLQINRMALFFLTTAALLAAGCSSSMNTTPTANTVTGPAFVVATDAPMAAVTSFSVQIQSITAKDASGNSVSLLSGTPTVDFARYNGLQTLLDMNDVPVGTYSSISVTLGMGTLGFLDITAGAAPTIQTEAANITQPTYTATLATPLVIAQAATPVGLRVDFDLNKSIAVDSMGQITGDVTPVFKISVVKNTDPGAYIDEFIAGVVSVNTMNQSFVVQGPHGEQFTVNVNAQTDWDGNDTLSSLTTSSIVQISGQLDKADQTIDADEVDIVSQTGFYASGMVTWVQPPTGTATSFDLYVRGLLPTNTGLTLGQIAQVKLTGSEKYSIYWMHNPMAAFLFNPGTMVPGQSVAVGGPVTGATDPTAVTVKRVVLRQSGFDGTVVTNSMSPMNGTFQMQVNGFSGVLLPHPITVWVAGRTDFRDGFGSFANLANGDTVRVVGLVLRDPTSGQPALLARYVDHDHD